MTTLGRVDATTRFASGPAGRLAYDDTGGGVPAVVLVHGGFGDRSHFAPVTAHLAPRHRVIGLDLRGHGDSDMPAHDFTVADLAADIAAVCDAAGVAHAVICGHSLSGAAALELAVSRPELISAVALLDGAILYQDQARQAMATQLLPALQGAGWRDALRGLVLGRMLTPHDPPEVRERVMHALEQAPRQVTVPWFSGSSTWDAAPPLDACTQPVLYVHATFPVDLGRLQTIKPDALVGRVVGSGHFVTLTVSDQVNAMLDRFLEITAAS